MTSKPDWWIKGTLFENCNCQIICPGHMGFKQLCSYERCQGFWGIHIDEGRYVDHVLDDLNMVIIYDAPQMMASGDWKQAIYIDETAGKFQREVLEKLITGRLGGPWAILSQFVSERKETRYVPIHFEEAKDQKTMSFGGIFHVLIKNLRGSVSSQPVTLNNSINQIHGPVHYIAVGTTNYSDHGINIKTHGSHSLHSSFSWSGNVPVVE